MRSPPPSRWRCYALSILAVLLALFVRLSLSPLLGDAIPYMAFVLAVSVSGCVGGLGPGLLATVLSAAVADLFILRPAQVPSESGIEEWTRLGLFLVSGTVISLVCHSLHSSREQERLQVAELEKQRAAHQEQREFLNTVLESLAEVVVACDARGNLTYVNRAGRETLALPPPPAPAEHWMSLYEVRRVGESAPLTVEARPVSRALRGERVHNEELEVVTRHDDASFCILASCRALRDSQGAVTGAVLTMNDITGRRKAQEALSRTELLLTQMQKMDVIGQLAGGIAHDFNNLLTVINGYSQLALTRLSPAGEVAATIQEVLRAGERAAGLTRQLLAFSRQQMLEPVDLDLNECVRETKNMLRRLIGEDVELAWALTPGLSSIRADKGQLEQVLLNLVVNARDAIPPHGRITIETAEVELDEEYARSHPGAVPGAYVLLAVSDNGCGMPEEVRQRIFEPFFTTKERGQGTGLGLATVFGIVRQFEGQVEVYSELGVGTVFKVYLPRVAGGTGRQRESLTMLEEAARGDETILMVEDDFAVRQFVRRVLEIRGYRVLEAADGPAALTLCDEHPGAIQLLVSDVVLPGLGGRELAERLKAVRPELRVLFISGYTPDAVIRHGVLEAQVAFLQKPFTPEALGRKVREVLDRKGVDAGSDH